MNPSSSPMLPALSSTLFISLLDSARQLQISDTFAMSSFIEFLTEKIIKSLLFKEINQIVFMLLYAQETFFAGFVLSYLHQS
jgi:hypothetical protein